MASGIRGLTVEGMLVMNGEDESHDCMVWSDKAHMDGHDI